VLAAVQVPRKVARPTPGQITLGQKVVTAQLLVLGQFQLRAAAVVVDLAAVVPMQSMVPLEVLVVVAQPAVQAVELELLDQHLQAGQV
jgi:hypothetical protein